MALRSFRSLVLGAALVTAAFSGGAWGQEPATPPTPAVASPAPLASAESRAARAKLDAYKAELDQKEAALQRQRLTGAELQTLRQEIDPTIAAVSTILILVSIVILFTAELLRQRSERARGTNWARVDEDLGAVE